MRSFARRQFVFLCLTASFLVGCWTSHGFDPVKDSQIDLPEKWSGNLTEVSATSFYWLDELQDETLNQLVAEGLQHNHDLRAAAARVLESRALISNERSSLFPHLDLGLNGSRTRESFGVGTDKGHVVYNGYDVSALVSWEVDVWGALRDQVNKKELSLLSTEANFRAVRLSLAANVASAWYSLIEAKQQEHLAKERLRSFDESLKIVESGYVRGVHEALDVRLASANVYAAKADLERRKAAHDLAGRALEILLGRYPSNQIEVKGSLPELTSTVPIGLPIELLERRPDLLEKKFQVLQKDIDVIAAEKSFLPRLSITGYGGLFSSKLHEILDIESLIAHIASQIAVPIFNAGSLQSQLHQAEAQRTEALWNYAGAVLAALNEVESALTSESYLMEQVEYLKKGSTEATAAQDLAISNYQKGLVDIVTVLESQRTAFDTKSQLLATQLELLNNRLRLHLALGGDFQEQEPPSVEKLVE